MSQGLFAAGSALIAQQLLLDAVANDLANVSTPGYRRTRFLLSDVPGAGGSAGAGVAFVELGRSQIAGAMVPTDNPLGVAIWGSGYLQVRLPDGTLGLTRVGDLRVDAGGALLAAPGLRLEPPVTLPPGTKPEDVRIEIDGTVVAAGKKAGALAIVDVPSPAGLVAAGGGIFVPSAASGAPAPAKAAEVRQGYLETSNVDLGQAMVEMLEALRAYQLAGRAVRTQDELLEIANGIRR